jgi:hypothetical protein
MLQKETITIVTGLPRSGTSLMMQILNKSNLEILSDGIRSKDISNPEGYFELEAVKGIVKDNSFLKDAVGKVVKIVAPLPLYIDKKFNYKVVFMRREIEEVLSSQEKMLNKDQSSEREKFRTIYEFHLKKTYHFFQSNNIPYLDIHYRDLILDRESQLIKVVDFLGINVPMEDLLNVVNIDLYRNKSKS